MTELVILILGVGGQWLLGIALASALVGCRNRAAGGDTPNAFVAHAEVLGAGLLLGIGATSCVQFLWSLLGGKLGGGLSWGITGAGIVAGVAAWVTCRHDRADTARLINADTARLLNHEGRSLTIACVFVIVILFLAALSQAVLTPQRLWDERAIFGVKAAVLFEDRSIASRDLAHPDFVQGHPRYPLLLPLAEQHVYALLGRIDDRWAKVVPPLLYFGMVLAFAGVMGRHLPVAQAWLFATVLATVPVLLSADYGCLSAQGDAPVACLHGVTLLYLWDAIASGCGVRTILTAAVFAALTIFTKDEGIAFFLVDFTLFGTLALVGLRTRQQSIAAAVDQAASTAAMGRRFWTTAAPILLFGVAPALLLAPWFWHRSRLPTTTEMNYFGRISWDTLVAGSGTLAWSVPHLLRRMFLEAPLWGLQWWAVAMALVSRPRRALSPPQLLLLGDILGALAALVIAGMIAPVPVADHLGGSSVRFLLQLAPAAILFVAGQWCSRSS